MAQDKPTPEEKAHADEQVERTFGDGDAAQNAKELESELGALEMDAETMDDPTLTAQVAAEEAVVAEQAAPAQQAAPDRTAQMPKPATPPRPRTPADDAAPGPQSREAARTQRELDRLGRDRAFKVYSWLGFLGGAFAVAWGFMILFGVDTGSAAALGGLYAAAYSPIESLAFLLKLGLFGILEALGLGLMGGFGRRLLRDESREQRLLDGARHHKGPRA